MRKIIFSFLICFSLIIVVSCSNKEELIATGTIQGKEIIITAKVPAQVKEVLVEEGKEVKQGDKIVILDDTEYKLLVNQAEAQLDLAKAQLAEAINGTRQEEINKAKTSIEQFEANILALKAQLDNLNKNLTKQENLYNMGAISEQQLDELKTQIKVLENQIKAVEKQKESAQWQLIILEEGLRPEVIDKLEAQVKNAQTNFDLAKYKLGYTIISSPIDGIINSLNVEPGENVIVGSNIASIINPEDLWVRVYLPEDVIGKISLGQKVSLKIDSFPKDEFPGEVTDIGDKAQFTPRNVQTKDQRTTMVFPVKVKILKGFNVLKIGLPADVYFDNHEKGENDELGN
ncbi:MAG: rane fusion protein YbhG [Clostridia bacterium]|nr:rane fusion protein YbhG [Clostridia bacterium]